MFYFLNPYRVIFLNPMQCCTTRNKASHQSQEYLTLGLGDIARERHLTNVKLIINN